MPNNRCFQFPLGVTVVPREIEDNGYAKFGRGGRGGKQGLCENGEWAISEFPRGIFTREVVYLASFWKWGFLELGSGLLSTSTRERHSLSNYTAFSWVNT